ncbi:MAG: hypothetical protein DRQ61_09175 [Gammaproteobacteria bacterium]|nr:MAG: hypothetical protein DRQ61_09175 [Gammaproteobacteria bacterium]
MNKSFNWLALSIAFTLMAVQLVFNDAGSGRELPLLTTLFINEVGAFISLFGLISGIKKLQSEGTTALTISSIILCVLFAATFFWNGYQYWPKS